MNQNEWINLKVKMLKRGITFTSLCELHGVTRQRIHQIIKKGYPARGRAKRVLDDFYGRFE